ncbi:hypothetical protein MC059_04550 [Paenibacillus alvei]|nr:hypothetical protein [Paenibacillus alvei]
MDTRRWSEQHEVSSDNCDYKRDCRLSTLMDAAGRGFPPRSTSSIDG